MFRDLPDRLHGQISESFGPRVRRGRRFHPSMLFELMNDGEDPATGWLMVISTLRDEAPWLYELGLDVHKALKRGDHRTVALAIDRFEHALMKLRHGRMARLFIDSPSVESAVHELSHIARHLFLKQDAKRLSRPPKDKDDGPK
jgi:hypothetical protein